jgi:hypothetical protein
MNEKKKNDEKQSRQADATQKRFTIAHEIGHFVIPYHKDLGNVCDASELGKFGKTLPRAELEANEFAAELLLPAALVRTPLRLETPSLETIGGVAKEFQTSLTAATWRFLDLTDQPCAMIWSQNRNARWYRTSDALPIELPLQELPALQSIAGRLFAQEEGPNAGPIDPFLWCQPIDAERIHTLIEESIHLPNYDAVLTLLWARKMDRANESDVEELLPELTPEEFSLKRKRWPR